MFPLLIGSEFILDAANIGHIILPHNNSLSKPQAKV